jgi:PAS domain S-box-containing protein
MALDTVTVSIWVTAGLAVGALALLWLYLGAMQRCNRLMSERNQIRDTLQEKEWFLRAVLDTVPAAINLKDERGRYRFINKGLADLYGTTPEEAVRQWNQMQDDADAGRQSTASVPKDPYDYTVIEERDQHVLETGKHISFDSTYKVNGRREVWSSSKLPMYDRESGGRFVLTVAFDVTRQRETEEKLSQAQKMEAIGQLTGGIAHDFNNLLAVIIGNLELAAETLPKENGPVERVRNALRAAQSGAQLTHRLLAFARRQPLTPVVINLNETIRSMRTLLTRSLGEQIEIEFALADDLWNCAADVSQVENAVLNLAINARDAMPHGGKLTIETGNVSLDEDIAALNELTPGHFAMIAVTDNGIGMSPDVARRAFEPFFTTKGTGKGSGLGLAMIYGFAKQSGGHAKIYSEEGRGTSVKIYLPRTRDQVDVAKPEAAVSRMPRGEGQTVLVVEDDDGVRTLVVNNLTDLGYRVLQADTGPAALAVAGSNPALDLLLTDVMLPGGMTGRQLSEALGAKQAGLRTLFMSGYAANSIVHHGRVDPGVHLLQKPFGKMDLAKAVVRALAGQGAKN